MNKRKLDKSMIYHKHTAHPLNACSLCVLFKPITYTRRIKSHTGPISVCIAKQDKKQQPVECIHSTGCYFLFWVYILCKQKVYNFLYIRPFILQKSSACYLDCDAISYHYLCACKFGLFCGRDKKRNVAIGCRGSGKLFYRIY